MSDSNTIQIIAEYIQKNEDALKQFREDIQGLGDDTEKTSEKSKKHEESTNAEFFSMTELNSAVGLVKEGYQLLSSVYDETIAKTLEQGNVVRELKNITGDSAEEISRAVQVLDDYKISSESLLTAQKFLGKQGFSLNIETLARLSDEYLKLETVQERQKFLTENLGKAGLDYAEVMSKGGDALRAQGAAVQQGLLFNDQQLKQMRELEVHQDNLNDNWTAIKNNFSMAVIPAVDEATAALLDHQRALEIMSEKGLSTYHAMSQVGYTAALAQAKAEREAADAAQLQGKAMDDLAASTADSTAEIQAASQANTTLLGVMQSISSENQNYINNQQQVKQKQDEIKAKISELIAQGYTPLSDKVKDLQKDYDNLGQKYDENAKAHQAAMNKILYDMELAKLSVGGLTDAEMQMAQQAGLAFGQLTPEGIETAKTFDTVAQAVADGKIKINDMQKAIELLPKLKTIDLVIKAITQISGGGHNISSSTQVNNTPGGGQNLPQSFAGGGIATGPTSGHYELLHGTEAVIPLDSGSIPVQMSGGGLGGSNVTVVLQIQSPITVLGEQQGREALIPFIEHGVKELQARGVLPNG